RAQAHACAGRRRPALLHTKPLDWRRLDRVAAGTAGVALEPGHVFGRFRAGRATGQPADHGHRRDADRLFAGLRHRPAAADAPAGAHAIPVGAPPGANSPSRIEDLKEELGPWTLLRE